MTTATGLPANVETYLLELRAELADLAADERDDLLAEVEASLLESAGDEPLAAQFGPPAAFAADLRASAGLPAKPAATKAPRVPRVEWRAVLDRTRVLAPIWWLVRGYVAVAMLVILTTDTWSTHQPGIPHLNGSTELGLLAIVAGVAVSVTLGLWSRVPRPVAIVTNLALVAAIIPVALQNIGPGYAPIPSDALVQQVEALRYQQSIAGLTYNGEPVPNVYPYDRRGRLLHDVRLFGSGGRPLDIGEAGADPTRRPVLTADGEALNAFPIRYRDPTTGKVTNPDAGPTVDAKPLTTPPLK